METPREQHADLLEALILLRQHETARAGLGEKAGREAICPPLGDEDILWFEMQCAVTLPASYRVYLQRVGDGWPTTAGRADGLYPLGHGLGDDPGDLPAFGLARSCTLSPGIAEPDWLALQARLKAAAGQDEAARAEALACVYGGLLPVGAHGADCVHCLVLNGPHRGRVVDLDPSGEKPPVFADAADFLFWYADLLRESYGMCVVQEAEAVA